MTFNVILFFLFCFVFFGTLRGSEQVSELLLSVFCVYKVEDIFVR